MNIKIEKFTRSFLLAYDLQIYYNGENKLNGKLKFFCINLSNSAILSILRGDKQNLHEEVKKR